MANTFKISKGYEEMARRDLLSLTPEQAALMIKEEIIAYYKKHNLLGTKTE